MAVQSMKDLFQVGIDILRTTVSRKSKKITAQTGSIQTEEVAADQVEWWQHVGFASRPPKAVNAKAVCQGVVIRRGNADVCVATRDLRGLDLYGNLAEGETCLYAPGETGEAQARILLKADGSINLFTKADNESSGSGMGIFVRPDGGIDIASHNGSALRLTSDGDIQLFNSSSSLQIKSNGDVKVTSTGKVEIGGASVTLGGQSLPGPGPLALALPTLQAIAAVQAEFAALSPALAKLVKAATPIEVAAELTTAVTAIATATTALAAITPLIPTKRTSAD